MSRAAGPTILPVVAFMLGEKSARVKSHACQPTAILLLSALEPDAAAIRVLVSQ